MSATAHRFETSVRRGNRIAMLCCDAGHVRVKRRYRSCGCGDGSDLRATKMRGMDEMLRGVAHKIGRINLRGRPLSVLAAAGLATSMVALSVQSVLAGALTNTSWSTSNNQAGAIGVNYAYSFKTATA